MHNYLTHSMILYIRSLSSSLTRIFSQSHLWQWQKPFIHSNLSLSNSPRYLHTHTHTFSLSLSSTLTHSWTLFYSILNVGLFCLSPGISPWLPPSSLTATRSFSHRRRTGQNMIIKMLLPKIIPIQCDQIWWNFAKLAIFRKSLGNFWKA